MEGEKLLLNTAFIDRDSYEYLARLQVGEELSPTGGIVWEEICKYYNNDDNASRCDASIIMSRIEREYPKHHNLLASLVMSFEDNVSSPNILEEYKDLRQENLGNEIASLLIEPTAANKAKADQLMAKYQGIAEATQQLHETPLMFGAHPEDFLRDVLGDNTVKLFPRVVNDKVGGGVPRGTHILVFARPEAGKSLVSINFAYGFCKQGLKVLYIGNEDPAAVMWNRLLCRFSGMNKYAVAKNAERAYELASEQGYGNMAFVHMSPGTCGEIERLVKQEKDKGAPFDCLIVDQLRNLQARNASKVEGLEENAIGVRGIAQRHNLVAISVTQAGDSAEGKPQLGMGDVDFSNTGIPAQVDVMIGVGVTPEWDRGGIRMLSFPKNKLSGDHEGVLVRVIPELSKVTSE